MFSGDEDELPSESELKEQLGKIYLKDQMDREKQDIRLFKEMLLTDGEFHRDKESRRKQFRWKNVNDGEWMMMNRFSSDEEASDDDDDDDGGNGGDEDVDKSKKFLKSLANRNWRTVRHEREQFVHAKQNKGGDYQNPLLSDNENDDHDDGTGGERKKKKKRKNKDDDDVEEIEESNSNSNSNGFTTMSYDEDMNMVFTSSSVLKCGILRKGQQLLKTTTANVKSTTTTTTTTSDMGQQKRNLDSADTTTNLDNQIRATTSTSVGSKQSLNSPSNRHATSSSSGSGSSVNNYLKKFSILNKDQNFISRLSNYVNRNFQIEKKSTSSSSTSRTNNNMVFTSIDTSTTAGAGAAGANDNNAENTSDRKLNAYTTSTTKSISLLKDCESSSSGGVVQQPSAKRSRYEDACESIFNHIN